MFMKHSVYNKSVKTRGTKTNLHILTLFLLRLAHLQTSLSLRPLGSLHAMFYRCYHPLPVHWVSSDSSILNLLLCHTCAYLPQAAQHNRLLISSDLMPGFPDGLDCLHAAECKSVVDSTCVTGICY